jgi:hypothetical protein
MAQVKVKRPTQYFGGVYPFGHEQNDPVAVEKLREEVAREQARSNVPVHPAERTLDNDQQPSGT